MHIAIEGIDGVGKTTLAKKLAKALNFKFVEKHLHTLFDGENADHIPHYQRITKVINSSDDTLLRAWFYALGNIYMREHYGNKDIVTDRYFASNYSWNGTPDNSFIFEHLIQCLGKPQITFLLYANENARINRLRQRNSNDPDLEKINGTFSLEMYKKLKYFLDQYDFHYYSLDTSELSDTETFETVLGIIHQEFPGRFAKSS